MPQKVVIDFNTLHSDRRQIGNKTRGNCHDVPIGHGRTVILDYSAVRFIKLTKEAVTL